MLDGKLTPTSVRFLVLRRDVATSGSAARGPPTPAVPPCSTMLPRSPCMLQMQPRVLLLPPFPATTHAAAFAAADAAAGASLPHPPAPAPTASPDVSPAGPDSTSTLPPAAPVRRLRPPAFLPASTSAPTPDPTHAPMHDPSQLATTAPAASCAPGLPALPAHVVNASGEPCLPARVPLSVLVSCPASDCLVEPEVLVRGQGMYLPATARLLCAPAGLDNAADSAAGPDVNGTACHEVVLWGLPPRPGVVLVGHMSPVVSCTCAEVWVPGPGVRSLYKNVFAACYRRSDKSEGG